MSKENINIFWRHRRPPSSHRASLHVIHCSWRNLFDKSPPTGTIIVINFCFNVQLVRFKNIIGCVRITKYNNNKTTFNCDVWRYPPNHTTNKIFKLIFEEDEDATMKFTTFYYIVTYEERTKRGDHRVNKKSQEYRNYKKKNK